MQQQYRVKLFIKMLKMMFFSVAKSCVVTIHEIDNSQKNGLEKTSF